ncbi:MAG: bifunctional DNA primase/polymerase [Pseudonocardia sp.]
MTTFAQAWPVYASLGWPGCLPLRPGKKTPPPVGWTGGRAPYPSESDLVELAARPKYRGTEQTALRLPRTVVGIDVDDYGDKRGGRTLFEAERRWGPLPDGPWSSAREAPCGIRFFGVPDGTVLEGWIKFPEYGLGDIEVIQAHHRYAVVWPSMHPTTRAAYTWRGTPGPDCPPAVRDLPRLPSEWVSGLARTRSATGRPATCAEVTGFLGGLLADDPCETVIGALRAAQDALSGPVGGRHDAAAHHVLALLRIGEQGHPGVAESLDELAVTFEREVTEDGSRSPGAARAEFARLIQGGIGLVLADPTPDQRRGCQHCGEIADPARLRAALIGVVRTVLTAAPSRRERLLRWAAGKVFGHVPAGLSADSAAAIVLDTAARAGVPEHLAREAIAGRSR